MHGLLTWRRRPGPGGRRLAVALAGLMAAVVTPAAAASAAPAAAPATEPGTPVAATAADGSVTVIVRNADGSVFRRVRDATTGSWGDWADTGHKASGNPAVNHDLNGSLQVFLRGTDDHLWRQPQLPRSRTGWGAWVDMGTPPNTTVAGDPVVVADNNTASAPNPDAQSHVHGNTDGRLEAFVLGADGGLWHLAQRAPNGAGFSGWEEMGTNRVGNPAAVVGGDGRIAVFSRTKDGHLWESVQVQPGTQQTPLPTGNWRTFDLGSGYTGDPAATTVTTSAGTLLQVFANRSDGHLWSVTQSRPGTPAAPTGTWDLGHEFDLGNELAGPATVVASTDGRLAVFGVNANHLVAYRSQTQTAEPGTNPDGIWAGGWAELEQQHVRSVTVQNTANGGFEVFAVGNSSATLYERAQLAAGTSADPHGYWLDWSDLAPIGSGPCGGQGSLACLNITNVGLGLALDLTDPNDSSSYVTRATPDPAASSQQWALKAASSGGTFSLVNGINHECVSDKDEPIIGTWHVHMAACSDSDASQQYYLEPVTPTTTAKPAAYRIRQVITGACLTALQNTNGDHPGNLAERIDCNNTDPNNYNTWQLGRGGAIAPGVLDLALDYAAQQCAADTTTNTCTFVDVTTPSAYQAAAGCVVGSVLYNAGSSAATYTASWSHMTGSQWSVGGTVEAGWTQPGGGASFKTSFTTSHTWLDQSTFLESINVAVPSQQFGWVEYAPVERETIGYWKITLGGRTWTVPGHNVSIAQDGTSGVTAVKIAMTSSTPPTDSQCKM